MEYPLVLFFIHGRAFVGGTQPIQIPGCKIYDEINHILAGIARKMPIVFVTCNYRDRPLGFPVSKELMAFDQAHVEPVGNYGVHDQLQALE